MTLVPAGVLSYSIFCSFLTTVLAGICVRMASTASADVFPIGFTVPFTLDVLMQQPISLPLMI